MHSIRIFFQSAVGRFVGALLVATVLLASMFLGFQSYLLSELRSRYPAQADDAKRMEAIAASQKDIPALEDRADFFLHAPVSFLFPLKALLFERPIKLNEEYSLTTKSVSIVGRGQGLDFTLDYVATNADQSVTIEGRLEGTAFTSLSGLGSNELQLSMRPIVRNVQVSSLALRGFALPGALLRGMNVALEAVVKEVSGRIASQKKTVALTLPETTIEVPIANEIKRITMPAVVINKASALVSDDSISILLRSEVGKEDASAAPPGRPSDFATFASAFGRAVAKSFPATLPAKTQATTALSAAFMERFTRLFPSPLSADSVVAASLNANSNVLEQTQVFDAGAFVSATLLLQVLSDEVVARQAALPADSPLRDIALQFSLANQSILFSAQMNELKVTESGTIRGSVTGLIAPTPGINGVDFQLAFSNLEVKTAAMVGWSVDPSSVHMVLNSALNVLLPRINALIPPISANVQTIRPNPILLASKAGGPVSITFSPNAIELPDIQMGRPIILISADGLRVALRPLVGASLIGAAGGAATSANLQPALTGGYSERFEETWRRSFDSYELTSSQIVVAKKLLSRYLNEAWPAGGIVGDIAIGSKQDIPSTPIRAPQISADFECNTRQCTRSSCPMPSCSINNSGCARSASCGRSPGECRFDCRREVTYPCAGTIWDPIRTCRSSFDDPVCLAQRTACNAGVEARVAACNIAETTRVATCDARANLEKARCDTAANAQKAACDGKEETLLGACRATAAAEVAACNVKKTVIGGLNALGDVGTVAGDATAGGLARVIMRGLRFNDDLSVVEAPMDLTADIGLSATIQFSPHLGAALIACAPTRLTPKTKVEVNESFRVTGSGAFAEPTSLGELPYSLALQPIALRANVRPAPLDALFVSNPEFLVTCPLVANATLLADLVGKGVRVLDGTLIAPALSAPKLVDATSLSALVDVANGTFSTNVPLDDIRLSIPLAKFSIGTKELVLAPRSVGKIIAFQ